MNGWWQGVLFASACSLALSALPAAGQDAIDLGTARQYFAEARRLSDADDGALWGRKLYGPMLFVDRQTRMVVANESDGEGKLAQKRDVYVGVLPKEVTIANTATRWAGKHWTMLMWPLPRDQRDRARLLVHEMWHRIQDDLGLRGTNPSNVHLDTLEGRLWLRLEWRALARALASSGDERKSAVEDALTFRRHRRSLFDDAAREERALENHEGLAEYTGVMLAGYSPSERVEHVVGKLTEAEREDSFVRSFAYKSGPPWGMLLDRLKPGWREGYTLEDDLGDAMSQALSLKPASDLKARATVRMKTYGGEDVEAQERRRDQRRRQRIQEARARFVDGPTLRIPLSQMQIEFNPNNLQPVDGVGTVYPTLRISDLWGILEATDGALVSADWTWVAVPVAATWDGRFDKRHPGWSLELKPGWTAQPIEKTKQWRLVRQP